MFFNDWFSLIRVVAVGALAYAGLVLLLRIFGKRTLSKMNAFDLVVTVALGSTLATVLLSKDVALAEGITAFVLLIALQYVITWSSVRWPFIERLVKAEPTLLYFQGRYLEDALRRQRVTHAEVQQAVRSHGVQRLEDVAAVVMETDGSMTVMKRSEGKALTALAGVANTEG
jgi:uncharacterized membrane protein YcaP (DUF421 family)